MGFLHILDINLSFRHVFEVFLMINGYPIVVFCFRGIFGEFGTVVRTVCGQCW